MAVYNDTPNSSICAIKSLSEENLKKIQFAAGGEIKRGKLEIKASSTNMNEVGKAIIEKIKSIQ